MIGSGRGSPKSKMPTGEIPRRVLEPVFPALMIVSTTGQVGT